MPKEKKKLPERLPVRPWPVCVGSDELDANRAATEYNSLKPNDPKREKVFKKYEDAKYRAEWD